MRVVVAVGFHRSGIVRTFHVRVGFASVSHWCNGVIRAVVTLSMLIHGIIESTLDLRIGQNSLNLTGI